MYVRQTEIAARMSKCKSLVVNAQQMQDGCMEVMDRAAVLDRVIAILVSFAVAEATSYTSPRISHPTSLALTHTANLSSNSNRATRNPKPATRPATGNQQLQNPNAATVHADHSMQWLQMDLALAQTPLPEDLCNKTVSVLCNDCQVSARKLNPKP